MIRMSFLSLFLVLSSICDAHAVCELSNMEKSTVIESIQKSFEESYIFPERVEGFNVALAAKFGSGSYDKICDYKGFAATLTDDLVAITKDKHAVVVYNPGFIAARRAEREAGVQTENTEIKNEENTEVAAPIDWNRWYAVKDNFGFEKVEVLDGNIGYIKFNFFHSHEWAKPKIDSAMGFVSNTNALIIDVTKNGGGYSPTDAYVASFFFENGSGIWSSSYDRPSDETETTSLFEDIGEDRYLDRPLYILVSEETFSLAESLAYGLKHFGKAIIVGTTSAGAAHGIDISELNSNFFLQVPISRNIHPVTKTDWEGRGVTPDIETLADNALKVAHLDAINRLIDEADHDRKKEIYLDIRETLILTKEAR